MKIEEACNVVPLLHGKMTITFSGSAVRCTNAMEWGFGSQIIMALRHIIDGSLKALSSKSNLKPPVMSQSVKSDRDSALSDLYITGFMNDMCGFVVEEIDVPMFETPLLSAMAQSVDWIKAVVGSDDLKFDSVIKEMNHDTFSGFQLLIKTLHGHGTTMKIQYSEKDVMIDSFAIERAFQRLQQTVTRQKFLTVKGKLLGLLPAEKRFEFKADEDNTIFRGTIDVTGSKVAWNADEPYQSMMGRSVFAEIIQIEKSIWYKTTKEYVLRSLSERPVLYTKYD